MADPCAFLNGKVALYPGDMLAILPTMAENSIDSVVCDPPYHLTSIVKRFGGDNAAEAQSGKSGVYKRSSAGFMGKQWDGGDIAFRPETWAEVLRVMKPGGHLVAFAAPKNAHRMICAIEDAGFEIRDGLMWLFGQGFPKSKDVAKDIDRLLGGKREVSGTRSIAIDQWTAEGRRRLAAGETGSYEIPISDCATEEAQRFAGFGTSLKPAYEPIVLARKPLSESSIAANVLRWGTGALNIDGCRVAAGDKAQFPAGTVSETEAVFGGGVGRYANRPRTADGNPSARWPANILHDGSEEVVGAFPEDGKRASGEVKISSGSKRDPGWAETKGMNTPGRVNIGVRDHGDSGSAARFFYTAKADAEDRAGSRHPTVKPLDLIQYLCRLITPPGGTVLDCFAGTGTTGEAAWREGFRAALIEREAEYQADIARRMEWALMGPDSRARAQTKLDTERGKVTAEPMPLFGEAS